MCDPGPRQEAEKAKLSGNRRGVGWVHSTSDGSIVLEKSSNKAVRSGGGEGGGKGPSRRKRSMLKHAPDTAPASACHKRRRFADRTKRAAQAPNVDHVDLRQEPGAGCDR